MLSRLLRKMFVTPKQQSFSFAPEYEKGYRGMYARSTRQCESYVSRVSRKTVGILALGVGLLFGYNIPKEETKSKQTIQYEQPSLQEITDTIDVPITKHLWDIGENGYEKASKKFLALHPNATVREVHIQYQSNSGEMITYPLKKNMNEREIARSVLHIQQANNNGRVVDGKNIDYRMSGVVYDREGDGLVDMVRKDYPVELVVKGVKRSAQTDLSCDPVTYATNFNYGLAVVGGGLLLAAALYVNCRVSNTADREAFMSIDDICEATGVSESTLREQCGSRQILQERYRSLRRVQAKELRKNGLSYRKIAEELGVSYSTARRDVIR